VDHDHSGAVPRQHLHALPTLAVAKNGAGDWLILKSRGGIVGREAWEFTLRGGELHLVLDDVADLWQDIDDD